MTEDRIFRLIQMYKHHQGFNIEDDTFDEAIKMCLVGAAEYMKNAGVPEKTLESSADIAIIHGANDLYQFKELSNTFVALTAQVRISAMGEYSNG